VDDVRSELRGRALWVVAGCLVCQMGLGFGYGFGVLAPAILEEFGWSRALLSSAQAPQLFVIALASPVVGFVATRFGARVVLSVSVLVVAAACAGLSAMQSWWHLALGWAVVGASVAGLGDIAVGGVVAQWVTRARGLALGIVYTGSNLGGALVTRWMAAVSEAASWRAALLSLSLLSLGVLLPFALFAVRDRPGAEAAPEAPRAADAQPGPADLDVRGALRTRSFWIVAFTLLIFWVYLLSILQHLVLFLMDEGLTLEAASAHLGNAVFMGIFSKIAFGVIADRLSAKRAALLDFGLLTASAALLLALPHAWLVWAFVALFGFSYAARDVVTPLVVAACFGPRNLAAIYGVLMLTILPGGTLGPILTGWTHDATGSYTPAFAAFAAANLASFALLFGLRDERGRVRGARAPRGAQSSERP